MAAAVVVRDRTTTGWTPETVNEFHPGDVIGAIAGYTGFSPHRALGITELVCHTLGRDRGYWQGSIDGQSGQVFGFEDLIQKDANRCRSDLRTQFPAMAQFADQYNRYQLRDLQLEKSNDELIKKIEAQFGNTVTVTPISRRASSTSEPPSLSTHIWTFAGDFFRSLYPRDSRWQQQ